MTKAELLRSAVIAVAGLVAFFGGYLFSNNSPWWAAPKTTLRGITPENVVEICVLSPWAHLRLDLGHPTSNDDKTTTADPNFLCQTEQVKNGNKIDIEVISGGFGFGTYRLLK